MNEQVEAVKSKANQEADEVIKAAIRKREAGSISDEEADKIIRSAEKQRDNTINAAVGQKDGVIKAMRDQNADLDREVNVTTGEIKKVKDEWTSGWGNTFKKLSVGFVSSFAGEANGQLYSHWIGANASGTDNWTGGLTTLHEKGYEVYDLPRGTRVYNHEASEDMVLKTAEAVANKMIGNSSPNSGGISVVQNIYSPVNNPSELARQSKKELQKATLSWGG